MRTDPAQRGFTLVELLVVIGIIGVLIAILMPTLARANRTARATVCMSNLRQVGAGLLMYANDHRQHLPYVIEPVWRTDGTLDFSADPAAEARSLRNVLLPYLQDDRIYQCPSSRLGYPRDSMQIGYRVSSANNFDGQPRTMDYLMTPAGPRYEYSLKYLNGRVYRQLHVDAGVYPFVLQRGAGPFYVIRDFVSKSGDGEFAPPHPQKRYNQLRLDMSVTSEKDPRFAFTYP